jgi:pyruvate dehydrogenase complex dehydrogenase (E1) component
MSAVQPNHILSDLDAIETREWMDALSAVIEK